MSSLLRVIPQSALFSLILRRLLAASATFFPLGLLVCSTCSSRLGPSRKWDLSVMARSKMVLLESLAVHILFRMEGDRSKAPDEQWKRL